MEMVSTRKILATLNSRHNASLSTLVMLSFCLTNAMAEMLSETFDVHGIGVTVNLQSNCPTANLSATTSAFNCGNSTPRAPFDNGYDYLQCGGTPSANLVTDKLIHANNASPLFLNWSECIMQNLCATQASGCSNQPGSPDNYFSTIFIALIAAAAAASCAAYYLRHCCREPQSSPVNTARFNYGSINADNTSPRVGHNNSLTRIREHISQFSPS